MTAPRRIISNITYLLTRRCLGRMFLLRPSRTTNETLRYLLAVAAQRFGITIHAACILSNHLHAVLTDPGGTLPAFEQYLDSLVARCLNALHGRWETFWAPGSYSCVVLLDTEDVLEKIAYVLANPTAAGLVRRGSEWPGVWSSPSMIGAGPVLVKRPEHFFRKAGPMPEVVPFELVCPPGFASVEDFRQRLLRRTQELEDAAARSLAREGRSFLGAHRVLAQKPQARPAPKEPRRGLNPRVAGRDKWKRIEALQQLAEFRWSYRIAWERFAKGLREVLFPHGTYWMRIAYGVRCECGS